ncbi:response regulator [Paraburkholderia unamae]|uniref:Two-component system phosphate regulon response regulator OmpR n=1 Tax=Paraburkholderia unamae TaxID=219649 RepID=A0ABX5KDL2_9BURK|nr:response regulator transcription factor [Paraburkholderia unamae]PVX73217.1 two-component system phosphate regulon response regulator OmpR [Paraburkholderia unamae]CAG9258275.1 Two-component system phosphate regulon response regulator OmpR [Paraburkholderia unamae]
MNIHVLLVEPDQARRDELRTYLQRQQIAVSVLHGAERLDQRLERETPSLIILRHEAPTMDGIATLRTLRERGWLTPLIIVSQSADVADKVLAFEFGANDYMVEPFDHRELLARLYHALRCKMDFPASPHRAPRYAFDGFELDAMDNLLFKDGLKLHAPPLDLAVLTVFAANRLRPLSRERIVSLLDRKSKIHARSIDVIVFRLRRLLGLSPCGRQYIQTRYRDGYVFSPDDALSYLDRDRMTSTRVGESTCEQASMASH